MHSLRINVSDGDYENFLNLVKSLNVEIVEYIEDEFKIDTEMCRQTLEKIKSGDRDSFKKVTPDELFKELGL
jgi:hypothetical protein